jgi:hypothetical protein
VNSEAEHFRQVLQDMVTSMGVDDEHFAKFISTADEMQELIEQVNSDADACLLATFLGYHIGCLQHGPALINEVMDFMRDSYQAGLIDSAESEEGHYRPHIEFHHIKKDPS